MAKPPLSMKPTGWFQVAWSDEIGVGDVHRMKYFGQELIAWRAESGQLTVMDAYCEHLGAHLGFGGTSRARSSQCPFHGWQWNDEGRNVCIPYEDRPNRGRRIRTYPGGRAQRVGLHLARRRGPRPVLRRARRLRRASATAAARPTTTRSSGCSGRAWRLHPQYVLENGVDFAHFKFVHQTPIVPVFTRHDFDEPVSYVDFTITFEGDDDQSIEDVNSGVEAINGGLGIAVTKSWGMVDNRTISAITPVDEHTSDVRFMVYIGRTPGADPARAETRRRSSARRSSGSSARTSTSGRTSATRIRRRWRAPSTRASPQSASGPSSSIPTASAAAPPRSTPHLRKADPNDSTRRPTRSASSRWPPATSAPR